MRAEEGLGGSPLRPVGESVLCAQVNHGKYVGIYFCVLIFCYMVKTGVQAFLSHHYIDEENTSCKVSERIRATILTAFPRSPHLLQ